MTFAQQMRAGHPLLGPLLRMPNETLIELSGYVGLDFVIVDTEHGPGDQIPLGAHLTAAAGAGLGTLVRVGDPREILRVLDLGADGIIAPHVSSVEQARELVAAAHYPPRGLRGFATYSRAGRHGLATAAEHLARAAETLIIAMIEDGPGVAAAAEIAAVDGIDGLFVGPADLAVSLDHPGDLGHPEVVAAIATVHAAARAAGKTVVAITSDAAGARRLLDAGATVIIYNALAALGVLFTGLAAVTQVEPVATTDPIVLLPGMLETPAVWAPVAALLAPRAVRTLRLDLDDSIADMAASVLAQAPDRFALAGHSLGGIVALEVVRQAPQRVSRLALLNSSARAPSEEQLAGWREMTDRIDNGEFAAVADAECAANSGESEDLTELLTDMATQVGVDGLRRQIRAQAGRTDQRAQLAQITVPTLVVTGADDRNCPLDRQQEIAAGLPHARHEVLADSGHVSPRDAAPRVAALFGSFL